MKKIKLLDTFAGVGGFHLALEQSIGKENVECIGFSEIDKFATQVYKERFPNSPELGSITELDIDNLPDFDIVTGGFPCQDVSVAGKQSLEGGRTVLVEYLLQILEKKQPSYFVFENVKGLMSKKFDTFRNSIYQRMMKAGYFFDLKVMNTKDFGLPQNRERVFIVGFKRSGDFDEFNFPKGKKLTTFLKDILEEEVDEKYFLNEKQVNSITNSKFVQKATIIQKNICGTLMARDYKDPKCVYIKNATKKGYLEAEVGDGINLSFPNSKTRRGRVTKKISSTLMCNDMNGVLDEDYRIRKLTPTEYARLQGFPDGWSTDFISNSQAYKQMGNAISVPVVKALFDNLF